MNVRDLMHPAGNVATIATVAAAAVVLSGPSAHAGTGFPGEPSGPGVEPLAFSRTIDCGDFSIRSETTGYVRTDVRTGGNGTTRTRTVYLVDTTFTGPTGAVVEGLLRGSTSLVLAEDGSGVLRDTVMIHRRPDGGPALLSRAGIFWVEFAADGTETVIRDSGQQQDVTVEVCEALAP
jgi:hypothetical protein